ncbi:phosphate/phosphite/phosphonate ABC transporter substrate-binding protein [Megalodesulfovibrio paquesii]
MLAIGLVLVGLLALAGCSDDEVALRVDFSRRQELSPHAPQGGLTYAYLPQYSHTISYARHHRLVEYLREVTGLHIRQVFPATFDEHIAMVQRGEIDISYVNPFAYLKMARRGAFAFARIIEPTGSPAFRGEIIVRADNPTIKTVEDCRGKRLIAVDPSSAGGYLFPMGLFLEHGVRQEDFAEVAFAPGPGGKQEKVVLAVHAGLYDVGVVRDGTLNLLADRIDVSTVAVLGRSKAYPGWLFAARKDLPAEVVDLISKALFSLTMTSPLHAPILEVAHIQAVIPARDADYAPVRELVSSLNVDLLFDSPPPQATEGTE